ncbi:UvrD-helicase domain-containing protein [Luteolibacter luteus]|uniref:DNA 3'-5' helicase n=1 Tax=Luteolibacter luteus TaxID=2728835 RepID=A0A858RE38_9BACT|nr:UvrD-helicase domain-containing protein [Luteolibacter luteus]QJE94985.1 UvrD-helicase domain-containing protein [Luteolibacter luteus]
MILASAGSGKTFQLGNRVIGLVGAKQVDPARIVALTFTRKAAGEFADSVLSKLAECAVDPAKARQLCQQIGEDFEVAPALARVVKALPTFQLGTMDSFFARVVRGFQYELGLTGGTFELIEGPRQEAAVSDILAEVLSDAIEHGDASDFLHAFRRATLGKQGQGVLADVEKFLGSWHGLWKSGITPNGWGARNLFPLLPDVDAWEENKRGIIAKLRDGEGNEPILKLLDFFELHTVGSGKVAKAGVTFDRFVSEIKNGGDIEIPYRKSLIRVSGKAAETWRELFHLLAGCELAAAVARTRAVADLVGSLDRECERRLRRRGMLGFDDVKVLMGRWTGDEEARIRREAVDFRLDARYDHWLLDEFQDTSRAEWNGMVPLLDEAASREDGTLFVVGDRKQAIYGWRGGDVSLFDEIQQRYGTNDHLKVHTMPESWRSCPAVLDLVNRVCGDIETIRELFGDEVAGIWQWEDHYSAKPNLSGEAKVEIVAKDDRDDHLVNLLHSVGIGSRSLTCGVLVRTNDQVRSTAALLREHGFDVIEEGRRQPVADNAPGVVLFHLIRWLADPADPYAREVIAMSPVSSVIQERFGMAWQAAWEGLLKIAQQKGYAAMAEQLVEPLWADLSEFSRSRAGDVIGALAEFDASGTNTPREAVRWIGDLEIPQSPGAAAVQVLTIHKSKGLGFDVVVLPLVEDTQVPDLGDFRVARGEDHGGPWVLETPAGWVRSLIPALSKAEAAWSDAQRYEAMCVQYVALTRAKRGLYVLLPEVPKSRNDPHAWTSPANWIARSAGDSPGPVIFQSGEPDWWREIPARHLPTSAELPVLAQASPKRQRITPSGAKADSLSSSRSGRSFGNDLHAVFETIGWLDDATPQLPKTAAGKLVRDLLEKPSIREVFERRDRSAELHREQAVEAISDDRWISGIIDRLHVFRDPLGLPERIEVIDFKTDDVAKPEQLAERYRGQMEAYRKIIATAFGGAPVICRILSTKLRRWVDF